MSHYTAAIALQPDNATMYTNRAQANLKLCHWKPALADCDKAVALERDSYKAYFRRSRARQELGDLKVGGRRRERAAAGGRGKRSRGKDVRHRNAREGL